MAKYIKEVRSGQSFVITHHNIPVVDLVPHEQQPTIAGWKREINPIKVKGRSLSQAFVRDRGLE
jgi:antitoxin (DNA-binding transcriptional repressor) of toxin-antitoxin stability system